MENGLQTDPENHLHHPIITLSPPQPEMNSLPIFLYSHTLCGGAPCHIDPQYWHLGRRIGAQVLARNSSLDSRGVVM